jgi:hypothetical protein
MKDVPAKEPKDAKETKKMTGKDGGVAG